MSELSKKLEAARAAKAPRIKYCTLARTYRALPDDEDRATVRALIFSTSDTALEVAGFLDQVGIKVKPEWIGIHRRGHCQSCQKGGVWA